MHLVYLTYIYKWVIYDLYSYTRPVRAMHDSYESALALRVLFYFLRSLYVRSSPYLTRDTHYWIYYFWGTIVCHTFRITWLYQHPPYLGCTPITIYAKVAFRLGHGYGYIRIIHGWIIWVSIQMDSAGYANRIKRHLDFFCMCYPGTSGYPTIQRYIPGWISSSQGPGYYPDYPVPKSGCITLRRNFRIAG
jgi:hypothetical protein